MKNLASTEKYNITRRHQEKRVTLKIISSVGRPKLIASTVKYLRRKGQGASGDNRIVGQEAGMKGITETIKAWNAIAKMKSIPEAPKTELTKHRIKLRRWL
jgi:hypothetical protein